VYVLLVVGDDDEYYECDDDVDFLVECVCCYVGD